MCRTFRFALPCLTRGIAVWVGGQRGSQFRRLPFKPHGGSNWSHAGGTGDGSCRPDLFVDPTQVSASPRATGHGEPRPNPDRAAGRLRGATLISTAGAAACRDPTAALRARLLVQCPRPQAERNHRRECDMLGVGRTAQHRLRRRSPVPTTALVLGRRRAYNDPPGERVGGSAPCAEPVHSQERSS